MSRFVCSDCEYSSDKKFNVEKHIKIHNGEECYVIDTQPKTVKSLECPNCNKEFSRSDCLKKHVDSAICVNKKQKKEYKCSSCDKSFSRSDALRRHEKDETCQKQPKEKTFYKCQQCDYSTSNYTCFFTHTKSHGRDGEFVKYGKFYCKICDVHFCNLSNHIGGKSHSKLIRTFDKETNQFVYAKYLRRLDFLNPIPTLEETMHHYISYCNKPITYAKYYKLTDKERNQWIYEVMKDSKITGEISNTAEHKQIQKKNNTTIASLCKYETTSNLCKFISKEVDDGKVVLDDDIDWCFTDDLKSECEKYLSFYDEFVKKIDCEEVRNKQIEGDYNEFWSELEEHFPSQYSKYSQYKN